MRKLLVLLTFFGGMQLYAQGCVADISLTTYETSSPVLHQASNTIVCSVAYGVSPGYDATLRAGVLIELGDNTHIKPGSFFLAEIGECVKPRMAETDVFTTSALKVYPNPAGPTLNLSVDNMEMSSITLTTLDGRIIATYKANNETYLQLDLSTYASGIYLLTVDASNGQQYRQRIFKE